MSEVRKGVKATVVTSICMHSGDGVPAASGSQWCFIDATWFQVLSNVGIITRENLTATALRISNHRAHEKK